MKNKISIADILNKKNSEKITCLTAYTFPVAKILDNFCDIILVGDSLGMCVYGHADTVEVTVDMMINHGRAVVKASQQSLIVVDIPCGSFEKSALQACETAQKIIDETGCDAVKIETSRDSIAAIKMMVENDIAVMAHVGLLPQQVRELGGYKYQGRNEKSALEIIEIAKLAQAAGAFACVIEAVPAKLADQITQALEIPTIGIGASANCDGQVLVIDDLIGLNQEFKPRFVKNYASIASDISLAVQGFVSDVKNGKFPAKENLME